jgi:hypothetical protein
MEIVITLGVLWVIISFFWLRVLFLGTLLVIWTGFAVVAPLVFAVQRFGEGNPIAGILTLLLGGFFSLFWWIGAKAALKEIKKFQERGGVNVHPWNDRD